MTCITDVEGHFVFSLLPPRHGYMLKAEVPGFATVIAGPLDLDPGRVTVQNLILKPSSELQETVTVEAQGPIVDTSSTKTSTTYNTEFIEGLPLLGRRFSDLLTLAPGVTDADGDGHPNVRGARDTGLQIRLDGSNVTDPLTGQIGQDVNLETIEEVEIITSGASAEFGRADGGFANIITKSGGNEAEGSLKVFYRSDFLDGNGAGNNDQDQREIPVKGFSDVRAFLTLGGAMVKDHLWYFTSVERLDREEPVSFATGALAVRTQEGWRSFGKVTWQTNPDNKLAFQVNYDPIEHGGNFLGLRVAPETDYLRRAGGPILQLKWTSIISPTLLLESVFSRLDGGEAIVPVSDEFQIMKVKKERQGNTVFAQLPCITNSCRGDRSVFAYRSTYGLGLRQRVTTSLSGPYFYQSDDARERSTFKVDLSYSIEDRFGNHSIKSGFEFNDERYVDSPITNPQLTDQTKNSIEAFLPVVYPEDIRFGPIFMDISDPVRVDLESSGLNAGAYIQNSWKPVPNLTLNAGLRYDQEEIDTFGFSPFDPLTEAREVLRRFDILCDALGSACTSQRNPGRTDRGLVGTIYPPPGHPAFEFDLDGDGDIELEGPERDQLRGPLTSFSERASESYTIRNRNLAPRLSVSWDPWSDGRTKLFGAWNQYYDRLFLGTTTMEQESNRYTAAWISNGPSNQATPEKLSEPLTGIVSINQVDHDLATPHTIEWSVGLERELAPEWALTLTHISRRGTDLLQDIDVNHIICPQFDASFGVDPMLVCGDGGRLELDRFGEPPILAPRDPNQPLNPSGQSRPNGAPDLYALNINWNQVLRAGNFNSSRYTSTELALRKRLHRRWQMQLGYTYSKAAGQAERFIDQAGNDPAVSEAVAGYLDYDQRHLLKWQAVTHLPHDLILGGTVQWASGLPYSIVHTVADQDDVGSLSGQRTFFVTGKKNDQRNEGQWTLSGRIEKSFTVGRVHLASFLSGENLANADDLRVTAIRGGIRGEGIDGTRRFGRRFELGLSIHY